MSELSQIKGQRYQVAVAKWLAGTRLLGFDTQMFGDTYDASSKAANVGGVQFDLSLKLVEDGVAKRVLYVECKYRARQSSIGKVVAEFVGRSCQAFWSSSADERTASEFCLVASVPPVAGWPALTRQPYDVVDATAQQLKLDKDNNLVTALADRMHVLVLSPPIVGEAWT